jgi:hypothetical protein
MAVYDQRGQQIETQYNAGGDIIINPPPQRTAQQRNRQRLLAKVRSFWIEGVLERSLYTVALLDGPKVANGKNPAK